VDAGVGRGRDDPAVDRRALSRVGHFARVRLKNSLDEV
jgi:hypothetical protein